MNTTEEIIVIGDNFIERRVSGPRRGGLSGQHVQRATLLPRSYLSLSLFRNTLDG
jgi:hypothetical protein